LQALTGSPEVPMKTKIKIIHAEWTSKVVDRFARGVHAEFFRRGVGG
jgi:6,7-dimethyl-8-ribityllumazine synthase